MRGGGYWKNFLQTFLGNTDRRNLSLNQVCREFFSSKSDTYFYHERARTLQNTRNSPLFTLCTLLPVYVSAFRLGKARRSTLYARKFSTAKRYWHGNFIATSVTVVCRRPTYVKIATAFCYPNLVWDVWKQCAVLQVTWCRTCIRILVCFTFWLLSGDIGRRTLKICRRKKLEYVHVNASSQAEMLECYFNYVWIRIITIWINTR